MGCLECKKEIKQTPGKRERQFCNSTCRSNYWQKAKRKVTPNDKQENKKQKAAKPLPENEVISEMEKEFQEQLKQNKK